jgi:hypothetical protein
MKPARRVDNVDFLKEIRNDLLPLRLRGSEIDVEIAQQQRFTVGGAGSPGGAEVIHPHRVSGGDVRTHLEIAFLPCDYLERQEIGGEDGDCLDLEILMAVGGGKEEWEDEWW